jgi:prepilin-type N-terminal cleavage/methylation domain-containing protein
MTDSTRALRRPRRGFTLAEVLVSMVMISLIGVALTRLVVTQSRFSNKQVLQRNARGVARGALNIMLSELRTVEQSTAFRFGNPLTSVGVAIPAPTQAALVVNVPWAVGIRCSANAIAILPIDSMSHVIGAANTVGVAYRGQDERYIYDPGPSVTSGNSSDFAACTAAGITVTGADAMPNMRVATLSGLGLVGGVVGTPVMLFYRVRYEFKASTSVPGRTGLFRSVANSSAAFGTAEELVAPFNFNSGFRYFVGTSRSATSVPPADLETITGIQINLNALSEGNTQGRSTPETSNLSTAIFFRNRLN